MKKGCFTIMLTSLLMLSLVVGAQEVRPAYGKMSPMLRQMVTEQRMGGGPARNKPAAKNEVCLLLKTRGNGRELLQRYGAACLIDKGDLCLVSVAQDRLAQLSRDNDVVSMEARPRNTLHNDSNAYHLNALPVYKGTNLPQAYTGKGVVMGIMDVGFDLTHPTFFDHSIAGQPSESLTEDDLRRAYRIDCLRDQLSMDTLESTLYVGRDYHGADTLLALGRSSDAHLLCHGTHTSATAAGSGYTSPYRGMAPEARYCLVANAVTTNAQLIADSLKYKYTFETDLLGFKYIFDHAEKMNKPCVISFSEGSLEDYWGYDQLYYAMLDSLTGPGRIIVASAGNKGLERTWMLKPYGRERAGTFLMRASRRIHFTFKSKENFLIRFAAYYDRPDTVVYAAGDVLAASDSVLDIVHAQDNHTLLLRTVAYPSCYAPEETCYDLEVMADGQIGYAAPMSIEVIGTNAEVELRQVSGHWVTDDINPELHDGESSHNVHSPSTAPCVISVGSTGYRSGVVNIKGEWKQYEEVVRGTRSLYSSTGPTMYGGIKPDCMAPGENIISAMSSYFLEHKPDDEIVLWDVEHFDFRGRTYGWNAQMGTSMAAPAVGGTIALWLEANPLLTPAEALEVISKTARRPVADIDYPNNEYGYGEIDAYAGLLELLHLTKVEGLSHRHTAARVTMSNGTIAVSTTDDIPEKSRLAVYSLSGRCVFRTVIPPETAHFIATLPPLPPGIYAVQLSGSTASAGSTLVRYE